MCTCTPTRSATGCGASARSAAWTWKIPAPGWPPWYSCRPSAGHAGDEPRPWPGNHHGRAGPGTDPSSNPTNRPGQLRPSPHGYTKYANVILTCKAFPNGAACAACLRRTAGALLCAATALLLAACSGGSSSSSSSGGKAQSGGTITFAEQPGSPPTYIFPLYDGANSGNNNITYLQPLMWLPLYWFGHSNNAQATINYGQSMAYPPVFSDGGRTVTMKLKHYVWSNGKPVTSRDLEFWMNLLLAEKNNSAAYVPGGWMDHVAGMSAPSPYTFVLKFNVTYNQTYLLYNGLSILQPIPQAVCDKTSATGAVGNYEETKAGG